MPATPGSVYGAEDIGMSTKDSGASLASPARLVIGDSDRLHVTDLMTSTRDDDDDNASDISMSAETEDSDDDFEVGTPGAASRIISQSATTEPLVTGQKRRMSMGQGTGRGEDRKRVKLDLGADPALITYRDKEGRLPIDRSLLPAEIWHQIFTFTSPKALGRLLQVSKAFKAYLDTSSSASTLNLASLSMSVCQIRTPEAIWQSSRRLFYPGMPSPLRGLNELDIWKLACGSACQFCDRKSQLPSPRSKDQWRSGPGEDGVSAIWPFAIRSCGSCLLEKSIKEIDLLLSSSVPSLLMAALPFVFVTNDLHAISATTLQNESSPANVHMVKYFLKTHTEDIKTEFFKVKSMGSGTAEEWLKGLDERGRECRSDASRWERWELLGGVQRMQVKDLPDFESIPRRTLVTAPTGSTVSNDILKQQTMNNDSKIQAGIGSSMRSSGIPSHTDQPTSAPFSTKTPPRFGSPAQNGFATYPPRTFQQQRHERTKEEVIELKAARRAEIERRCMLLDPPLTPAVLSHMGSFQAAIQIIKPLDDSAWEVLKPRLLSQSEEAQQRENDLAAQTRVVQEKFDERRQLDVHMKEVKEVNDREWDDIQAPLRARIGGFADEIIREGWHGGEKVTKESSPRFAAEVLIYVRKRFYAEVAKDEAAARAAGREPKVDPPNGPFTQKLILENMKWVFDTKIKPLTEQYSKELFLCNGCENNFKFYGFEGVIQHYAAKHTSALSVGSIVVHWRAEWPEYPPFNPDPSAAINAFHSAAKSGSMFANGAATSPHIQGFGGYPPVSGQASMPTQALQQSSGYQQSPVPYYGQLQYGDQFAMSQTGQFIPPPAIQGQAPSFQGAQYQATPTGGYQPHPGQGYPVHGFDGPFPNVAPFTFDSPHPSQAYPVAVADPAGQIYPQSGPFQSVGQYNVGQYGTTQYIPGPRPVVPIRTEAYKAQLYDVAQTARDVWNQTAGVKDMPGSVRVYVILHHILKRSRAKYPDDPPLAMLIDGLSNDKDMRPVRNVNGLVCRACRMEKPNGNTNPYKGSAKGSGANDKKLLSLPQLFKHFQSVHIEGPESSDLDWTEDMVELPDAARISLLARAQGMDDNKLQLVSEALPESFKASPPQIDQREPEFTYPIYSQDDEESKYGNLAPSKDDHQKYYTSESRGRYPEASNNQYDNMDETSERPGQNTPILVTSGKQRHFDDRQVSSRDLASMAFIERRRGSPITSVRAIDEYGRHVFREDGHFYAEQPSHYRDPDPEYKRRRPQASEVIPYDEPTTRIEHGYAREVSLPRLLEMTDRLATTSMASRGDHITHVKSEQKPRSNPSRPVSHSSLRTRNHQPSRADPIDGGSEDGELRTQTISMPQTESISYATGAGNPAERFLNEFQPGKSAEEYAQKAEEAERRSEDALRARWDSERIEGMRRMHQPVAEQYHRAYGRYEDDGRAAVISLPPTNKDRSPEPLSSRSNPEKHVQQQQTDVQDYDDRYIQTTVDSPLKRPRSRDIEEHRQRLNDVRYRDDRETVHGNHPTQSRFGRYDGVRVESDRARSRSPVYVKLGALPGQYRDQSPQPRYPQEEPLYRTRTPQSSVQEVSFERIPRQEYYRVYADEPRPREIHHESAVQYVQVANAKGDYLIRRPIRRDVEPVYAAYEDGNFASRQAVYESRAQVSKSDPAYYEEYDPRHPAPPSSATVRQIRYQ